jgi:hypothetical protein
MARMGSSAKASLVPLERIEQYDCLIGTLPGVARKGATMPYTSVNGNMFSFLTETGTLALRLPPGDREVFIERHATTLHEAHGTVMKEYVTVPFGLLADTKALSPSFRASHDYAAALKPKATRRST